MLNDVLHDPSWFPDRIDPMSRRIRFVRTSREVLAGSSFLDGRTPLGAEAWIADLEDVAAAAPAAGSTRWIFHTAFCGSTLLARMCDAPGRTLALREPQVLTDLSTWRAKVAGAGRKLYDATVSAVLGQLGKAREPGEQLLIKPSNWVNGAVGDLWRPGRGDRAVVMDNDPRPHLVAVLRGGRPRIEYVLRNTDHLLTSQPALHDTAVRLLPTTGDPFTRALRLATVGHWAQEMMFRARCREAGVALDEVRLTYPVLAGDGEKALGFASERLDLGLTEAEVRDSVARNQDRHSKNDGQGGGWDGQDDIDRRVEAWYRDQIDEALRLMPELNAESPSAIESLLEGMPRDPFDDRF